MIPRKWFKWLCTTPNCSYLSHEDSEEFKGFCCQRCFEYDWKCNGKVQHGHKCQRMLPRSNRLMIPSIRSSVGNGFDPAGYCMWKSAECYHWHFGREKHVAACSSLSGFCTLIIYSFWLLQIYCCPALLYLRTSSADRSLPVTISFCVGFLIGLTFALDSCSVFYVLWLCLPVYCCSQLNVWLGG